MSENKLNQNIKEKAAILLAKDKLNTFLDFYNFINNNKLGKGKTGKNTWAIKYKNKRIGSFRLHENSWSIRFFDLFDRNKWFEKCEKHLTADIKKFILANINTTSGCCIKGTCHSAENRIILGKTFRERVCACGPVFLSSPEDQTLEYAKELALMGKKIIAETAIK